MATAIFGFVGVVLGALTTSVLTIYRERLTTRREQDARDTQYERERKTARDTFQRDSILALQTAISDLIRAVHQELDRVLAEFRQTRKWPVRQWETPTAAGWSDALLRLELARARVFDDRLRSLAAPAPQARPAHRPAITSARTFTKLGPDPKFKRR
jgi:hypothetical protein